MYLNYAIETDTVCPEPYQIGTAKTPLPVGFKCMCTKTIETDTVCPKLKQIGAAMNSVIVAPLASLAPLRKIFLIKQQKKRAKIR